MRNAYKTLIGNLKGRHPFGDTVIDGRVVLKWMLDK
jgi:hypothetical protein